MKFYTIVSVVPAAYAAAAIQSASMMLNYVTINNPADPTFNQLLGISNSNNIAGYFGSGMNGHPNKGYVLMAPNFLSNIVDGNVPSAAQTQDICINNLGQVGGFWTDAKGTTLGFVRSQTGQFTNVMNPQTGTGTTNQILGINDGNFAVGFYTDAMMNNHAYSYNIATQAYANIVPPAQFGCTSTTASGTNNMGDIVGFCTTATGIISFWANNGMFVPIGVPGSNNTQALGINNMRQVVGFFNDAANVPHGFVATNPQGTAMIQSIDHPMGPMGTTINGINDAGTMVGFYVDAAGNTNGMVATPGGTGAATVAPGSGMATGGTMGGMGTMGSGTNGGMATGMGGVNTAMATGMNQPMPTMVNTAMGGVMTMSGQMPMSGLAAVTKTADATRFHASIFASASILFTAIYLL